jgi:deoxyribonuclease-4
MSIAGGCHEALLAARRYACPTVQLFTKNSNQWKGKELTEEDVATFRRIQRQTGIRPTIAHDSYLINLASPDDALYRRSIDAFVDEMTRAERLGIRYLVTHPGAHMESGEEVGLRRVAAALDEACRVTPGFRVRILLETTAGQGTSLGHRFEHLAWLLANVAAPRRFGVCVDTCHVFAAGYGLFPETVYRETMRQFDRCIGLSRIKVFHLNDSVKPLGSRVDRHAHIGEGQIGLGAFRLLLNDPRFRTRAMIMETPKEGPSGEDMDARNLKTLRGLVEKPK